MIFVFKSKRKYTRSITKMANACTINQLTNVTLQHIIKQKSLPNFDKLFWF